MTSPQNDAYINTHAQTCALTRSSSKTCARDFFRAPASICWEGDFLHTRPSSLLSSSYSIIASYLGLLCLRHHHTSCGVPRIHSPTAALIFGMDGRLVSCHLSVSLIRRLWPPLLLLPPGHSPQSNTGDTLHPMNFTSQDSPTPLYSRQQPPGT